jgi:hypothetical protein
MRQCKRCRRMRLETSFIDGIHLRKLCAHCREYNRKIKQKRCYRKVIPLGVCTRCLVKRPPEWFKDPATGQVRVLCYECRLYNQSYMQDYNSSKREMTCLRPPSNTLTNRSKSTDNISS